MVSDFQGNDRVDRGQRKKFPGGSENLSKTLVVFGMIKNSGMFLQKGHFSVSSLIYHIIAVNCLSILETGVVFFPISKNGNDTHLVCCKYYQLSCTACYA